MPASPGLRIGVPASTPNTPTFVIENVPPRHVAGRGLARARRLGERADRIGELDEGQVPSASRMFGTTSPRSVAAAMPRFT